MAKKLTSNKAKKILHDKSVHGHPLTDKQRRFFGAIAGGAPIKAQDGTEDSYTSIEDKSLQQSIDFLKDWYTKRATIPEFKDVSEKRLALLEKPIDIKKVSPSKLNRAHAAGMYDPMSKKLILADPTSESASDPDLSNFMDVNTGSPLMTHEIGHKLQLEAPYLTSVIPEEIVKENTPKWYGALPHPLLIDKETGKTVLNLRKNKDVAEFYPEMESVTAMLRQEEKIDPLKPVTADDVNSYINKYGKYQEEDLKNAKKGRAKEIHLGKLINSLFNVLGNNPEKIAKYLNSVAMNESTDSSMAKNGGWLNKYADGGTMQEYQENYNDNTILYPPGFVGMGNNTQGRNYSPAWGGQFAMGGSLPGAVGFTYARTGSIPSNGPYAKKTKASAQDGLTFLEPNSSKLPQGYMEDSDVPSTERAMSIGGEDGEPAYLIPSFKYGKPILGPSDSPYAEFRRTGEHLGGPFKTWQEADEWEQNIRHPYVEKGQSIPTPLRRWGKDFENGGSMSYYQHGLDWKPKSISKNGSVIEDNRGQWAHPGKITKINSNQITMKGVDYPVLGISDAGDTQMMYPDQEYTFKGKNVTEIPMAQNGLGGTRADSLILLNNSIAKDNFYKNNPEYFKSKSSIDFKNPKVLRDLAKSAIDKKNLLNRVYNSANDSEFITKPSRKEYAVTVGDIKRKLGKVKGSSDVYSAPDIFTSSSVDTYFNPASPPIFFSPSILPQGSRTYSSTKKSDRGDISESPYYDPLAVTPWDMLKPEQQKERLKKYGKSGTPYANPNYKPQNDSSSKSKTIVQTTQKPKPEPTLKKKVSNVAPISVNNSFTPGVTSIQHPNIEIPNIPQGEYRTSYWDPEIKDWNERAFMSQQESDQFANEMSQRGYGAPYGNVTQTKKINKKSTGGWLEKYN